MAHAIFDEMRQSNGLARSHYATFDAWLKGISAETVQQKQTEADFIFRRTGITFALNGDEGGTERLILSDLIPLIIDATDWALSEKGMVQRCTAITMFFPDVYH